MRYSLAMDINDLAREIMLHAGRTRGAVRSLKAAGTGSVTCSDIAQRLRAALVVGSGEKSTGVRERTTVIVVGDDPSAVSSPPAGALPLALPILLLARRRRLLFADCALRETLCPPVQGYQPNARSKAPWRGAPLLGRTRGPSAPRQRMATGSHGVAELRARCEPLC